MHFRRILPPAIATVLCLTMSHFAGQAGEKIDSELVPPEVTVPAGGSSGAAYVPPASSSTTAATPAPGTAEAGNSGGALGASDAPAPPPGGSSNNRFVGGQAGPITVWPGGINNPPNTQQAGGPNSDKPDPLAVIETNKGAITIRLFRKFAPMTVSHFMEMVQKGFYNGLTFHRVEPGFVIQGGCPKGDGTGLYYDPVTNKPKMTPLEASPKLRHNAPGVVAMAHFPKNPNSSSCQFYITLSAQARLDGNYSIFGGVVSGMDVVKRIEKGDKMTTVSLREQ